MIKSKRGGWIKIIIIVVIAALLALAFFGGIAYVSHLSDNVKFP